MRTDDKSSFSGDATNFGGLYDQIRYNQALAAGATVQQALKQGDPGIGTPRLGTINTASHYGIAVPTDVLRANFGNDESAWRTARAELNVGDQTVTVPIIDVGPGKKQQKSGVVVDVSNPLSDALGGFDRTKASVKLIPNAGPDYKTHPDDWHDEQADIRKQLSTPKSVWDQPSPSWTSLIPSDDETQKRLSDALPVSALTANL
jgi:hypothetical protein